MSHFPPARPPRTGKPLARKVAPVATHVFTSSGQSNHAGVPICSCGALQTARVHVLPETHPDAAEVAARILGEGGAA